MVTAVNNNKKDKPFVALVDLNGVQSKKNHDFSVVRMNDPCNGIQARQYLTSTTHATANDNKGQNSENTANTNIYEMQSLSHPKSSNYSSFFVGSRVISNPSLHLINRVDPLFLLLAYFDCEKLGEDISPGEQRKQKQNWQPWNQLCESIGVHRTLQKIIKENKSQLKHFFQINNYSVVTSDSDASCGGDDDDFILYKFQVDKVLAWLHAKVKNVQIILKKQLMSRRKWEQRQKKKKENSDNGAFSSSFILPASKPNLGGSTKDNEIEEKTKGYGCSQEKEPKEIHLTKEDELQILVSSIQVICEYISPSWQAKLLSFLDMDVNKILRPSSSPSFKGGGKATKQKKGDNSTSNTKGIKDEQSSTVSPSPSSSPALLQSFRHKPMTESEKLVLYTMGGAGDRGSGAKNDGDPNDRKRKSQQSKTAGLKRLEKVNTKGMKKLSSFFGPASKKKKTK